MNWFLTILKIHNIFISFIFKAKSSRAYKITPGASLNRDTQNKPNNNYVYPRRISEQQQSNSKNPTTAVPVQYVKQSQPEQNRSAVQIQYGKQSRPEQNRPNTGPSQAQPLSNRVDKSRMSARSSTPKAALNSEGRTTQHSKNDSIAPKKRAEKTVAPVVIDLLSDDDDDANGDEADLFVDHTRGASSVIKKFNDVNDLTNADDTLDPVLCLMFGTKELFPSPGAPAAHTSFIVTAEGLTISITTDFLEVKVLRVIELNAILTVRYAVCPIKATEFNLIFMIFFISHGRCPQGNYFFAFDIDPNLLTFNRPSDKRSDDIYDYESGVSLGPLGNFNPTGQNSSEDPRKYILMVMSPTGYRVLLEKVSIVEI